MNWLVCIWLEHDEIKLILNFSEIVMKTSQPSYIALVNFLTASFFQ